jgi:hypothetical protein
MEKGVTAIPGEDEEESYGEVDEPSFFSKYNLLNQTDNNILDFHNSQFLTVRSDIPLTAIQRRQLPAELSDLFPARITGSMESCYWLKVVFPPNVREENLNDLNVCINAFPVANKTLYSPIHKPGGLTDIIPLRTKESEHFLSMENVTDSHGHEYKPVPYTAQGRKLEAGTYNIKRGGVERFDRRDTGEYLERLIDLLRSESAAFSSLDMDNMRNIIDNVQQGLMDIETKYSESKMDNPDPPHYLLLNTIEEKDTVHVEYWGTSCEQANGLRAGQALIPRSSLPMLKNSCRLLKTTGGGKSPANATGRLDAFRYVLTSRDQILTDEDICNFCRCILGERVSRVSVTKGLTVSPKPKEGLIRTIDVSLTPAEGCESMGSEMQAELLAMLRRRSPGSFNFRIMIKSPININS